MDDVIKMYAMNDGNPNLEPAEMSADHDEMEEDDEVETSTVLTSSDDDEGVEEGIIIVEAIPVPTPAPKKWSPFSSPLRQLPLADTCSSSRAAKSSSFP